MEDRLDIRACLDNLGASWQFGGSVTDGTKACWDAVSWEDARHKPTWSALVAVSGAASNTVPKLVTPRQAKLALLSAGLLDEVEAAIDAIADPATKRVAQIEWEYAQEIERGWPLLVQIAGAMGMTDAELDELFIAAATL